MRSIEVSAIADCIVSNPIGGALITPSAARRMHGSCEDHPVVRLPQYLRISGDGCAIVPGRHHHQSIKLRDSIDGFCHAFDHLVRHGLRSAFESPRYVKISRALKFVVLDILAGFSVAHLLMQATS